MSRLAVLVAIVALFAHPHPADARSDLDRLGLKGRVKQVVTERAVLREQDGLWRQEPSIGISTQVFDPEGWLIESSEHDPEVWPHVRVTVKQEPDGSITRDTRWIGKDRKVQNRYVEIYDSQRRLTAASELAADGSLRWRETVSTNSFEETIQERVAADGTLVHRASWFDARDGFRIVHLTNYENGSPAASSRQVYNRNGRLTLIQRYGKDGQAEDLMVFDDEPDGRLAAATDYTADGAVRSRRILAYDVHGHQARALEIAYEPAPSNRQWPHPEAIERPAGFETATTYTLKEITPIARRFVYEVDGQGNWITQTTWHCGKETADTRAWWHDANPCEVTRRTITYYDDQSPETVGRSPSEIAVNPDKGNVMPRTAEAHSPAR